MGTRGERLAKLTALEQGFYLVEHRMKAKVKTDESRLAACIKRAFQLIQSGKTAGNRLFYQQSRASLSGSDRHLQVQLGRVSNDDPIRLLRKRQA